MLKSKFQNPQPKADPPMAENVKSNPKVKIAFWYCFKSIIYGLLASTLLISFYFTVISLISGWHFAQEQFFDYWYYIVSLAVGFGIQICLYVYLKNAIHNQRGSGKVLAVSGTTSTAAMISCCAHYLVNILPVLGIAGALSIIAQYQVQLFWVGLAFNLGGIIYIGNKLVSLRGGA